MINLLMLIGLIIIAWIVLSAIVSLTLTVIGFAMLILVWIFIGFAAGQLIRGKGYGPINDMLIGLGGAILGTLLFGLFGVSVDGLLQTILVGVPGAIILVYLVRVLTDRKDFAR
ncbi:MAG: GlsB/YeaQ/YmgE family stress response membrane protein [Chloroflexota bacterium]